jgi:hypothetical protein
MWMLSGALTERYHQLSKEIPSNYCTVTGTTAVPTLSEAPYLVEAVIGRASIKII